MMLSTALAGPSPTPATRTKLPTDAGQSPVDCHTQRRIIGVRASTQTMEDNMAANNGGRSTPIRIELVSDSSADAATSRIPGAIAAATLMPGAVAAVFATDDGERSFYNDPAILRAGDSGQTYTGTSGPMPEITFSEPLDVGGAVGDGE